MTDMQDAPSANRFTEGVHESTLEPDEELGINWPRFGSLLALLLALLVLGGPKVLAVALAIGGFLVFHEAGHYFVAKWSGMKVTEFFIGFGSRILAFKRGETTFGLKVWIPFGAYVRIVGMNNLEDVDPVDEPRTYRQAAWHKRVLTIVAGPATHFVTAMVLLTVLIWQYGQTVDDENAWALAAVDPTGVVADAGLQNGDRLVQLGGLPTETTDRLAAAVSASRGEQVEVIYERLERNEVVRRSSVLTVPEAVADGDGLAESLGFVVGDPDWAVDVWAVGSVTPFSAAERAGVLPEDRIVSIDGASTQYFSDLAAIVPAVRGEAVTLEVIRDGENLQLETRIWERLTAEGARGYDGLYFGDMVVSFEGREIRNYAQFAELAADRIGDTVEVEVVYNSTVHTETIRIDQVVTDGAVQGFLGVSRGSARETASLTTALASAPGQLVDTVQAILSGVKQLVTTADGWRGMFALGPGETDLTASVDLPGLEPGDVRPVEGLDNNRPISIIGVVRLANQLDTGAIIGFLAVMNLFFGLFNLAPLLPLDGGHVVLATYERIRSIGRSAAYHADAAKLIPLTYVVVAFFLVIGVISMVRDIVDPIQL